MIFSFFILIIGLVGAAFFAGTETAFVKLLSFSEDISALPCNIRKWLKRPQTILSTTLIGTNICIIMASSVATGIAEKLFTRNGELYSLVTITLVGLIFCEVLPKSRALAGPESFARFASKPFNIAAVIFKPISHLTDLLSSILVRFSHRLVAPAPPPDWKDFELVTKEGELKLGSNRNALLDLVFDLTKKTAFDIMTPIGELQISTKTEFEKAKIETTARDIENRFLLIENEDGEIEEVLDIAELICYRCYRGKARRGLTEPFYVPETTSIMRLFAEMRDSDSEFALVVDEHGTVTGGICREEIADMFSGVRSKKKGLRGKTIDGYIVDGTMNIGDLAELLDIEFPDGPFRTAAGFIEEIVGDIPEVNRPINWGGYVFVVMNKTARKIHRIRIEPK